MKQKTIELAQALIRRPSISPNDEGCQQLIAEPMWCRQEMKRTGLIRRFLPKL